MHWLLSLKQRKLGFFLPCLRTIWGSISNPSLLVYYAVCLTRLLIPTLKARNTLPAASDHRQGPRQRPRGSLRNVEHLISCRCTTTSLMGSRNSELEKKCRGIDLLNSAFPKHFLLKNTYKIISSFKCHTCSHHGKLC